MGGAIVEPSAEAGHPHCLLVEHEEWGGRPLILAAACEEEQDAWLGRLSEAAKLTVRNARLGEAMILELEGQGLRLTKEKADYAERLQSEVAALREEMERSEELARVKAELEAEKEKLEATTEELKSDLVAVRAELELTMQSKATLEQEKLNLNAQTQHLQVGLV